MRYFWSSVMSRDMVTCWLVGRFIFMMLMMVMMMMMMVVVVVVIIIIIVVIIIIVSNRNKHNKNCVLEEHKPYVLA